MAWAERTAELSHARRLQVGAVIVKDDSVISYGYNGMPAGWDNNCEDEIGQVLDDNDNIVETRLKTKPEVLHAEMNSLMKLAKSTNSGNQASMFITHSPCLECAKGIYQAGIKEVFYGQDYRSEDGIVFLKKCGIKIEKIIKDDKSNRYYSRRL
jgi:dCMP deaminase